MQVEIPHHRSPHAMKFEDRSQEETERQQRCALKQGMENCQKHIQAQRKKDKATFYSPAEEWVLPAASTKELEGKRFCGRFRSLYAYGQQETPELC